MSILRYRQRPAIPGASVLALRVPGSRSSSGVRWSRSWPLSSGRSRRGMLACPAVTFLWAGVNLAIGATTLTLLLWLPLAAYVAKQVVSLAITGAGTIDRAVRTARREGFAAERPRSGLFPLLVNISRRPRCWG